MNDLLVKCLIKTGMVKEGKSYIFDYDNQLIANEKYDAKQSYKSKKGYVPGIAQLNGRPCYIENRDGNVDVKFKQSETLRRAFSMLQNNDLKVSKARMDCGSYGKEVIEVVAANCEQFYIRARQSTVLQTEIAAIAEEKWREVEINYERCFVSSIPFTAFHADKNYRLVIQLSPRRTSQSDLFYGNYACRAILTNDWESAEEDEIAFYNHRAATERTFD